MTAGITQSKHALVADHALVLHVGPECAPLVHSWLPEKLVPFDGTRQPHAAIRVAQARVTRPTPVHAAPPTLVLGTVRGWVDDTRDLLWLQGAEGCVGTVDLLNRRASVAVPLAARGRVVADISPMLTIASALLLGRLGRALIHAGAVIAPDGYAWLLVGDARSGKSTICANLINAGWGYVSDDHVVLSFGSGGFRVEGWRRPFHLDRGWGTGTPTGVRCTANPARLGPGVWHRTAPLAATVVTSVVPAEPTVVKPLGGADLFAELVRQSPWLLADRASGPRLKTLLMGVASQHRIQLQLGLDTFSRLSSILALFERNAPTAHQTVHAPV